MSDGPKSQNDKWSLGWVRKLNVRNNRNVNTNRTPNLTLVCTEVCVSAFSLCFWILLPTSIHLLCPACLYMQHTARWELKTSMLGGWDSFQPWQGHSLVGEGPICLLTCLPGDLTPALRADKQLGKGLTEHPMLNLSDKRVMRANAVPGCYCCFVTHSFPSFGVPRYLCPKKKSH